MGEAPLEVIVERWNDVDGSVAYLWSVWRAGRRVHMGGKFDSPDAAERAAVAFCDTRLGTKPQQVRVL